MSDRLSVTVPDGIAALVEGLSRQSAATEDAPYLSKARVFRLLAASGAEQLVDGDLVVHDDRLGDDVDGEMLLDLVPDHVRARYLREEVRAENWLNDMRGGFKGRVRDVLAERFKNGYTPEGAAEVAEGLIKEARIYWVIIEDEPARYEEAVEYVHDRLDDYAEKYETTTWDFEEDFLGGFEGVESGRDREVIAENAVVIVNDISERLERVGADVLSPDDVVRSVSKKYGVSEQHAWDLVRSIGGYHSETEALTEDVSVPALEVSDD